MPTIGRFSLRQLHAPFALLLAIVPLALSAIVTFIIATRHASAESTASLALSSLGGDLLVLKQDSPFDEVAAIQEATASVAGVEQAAIFSISSLSTQGTDRPALIKVEPLANPYIRSKLQKFLSAGKLPSEQSPEGPVEVAVGADAAVASGLHIGDHFTLVPAPVAGNPSPHATTCVMVGMFRFGFAPYDQRLVLADNSQMARLGLSAIGIDVWLRPGSRAAKVASSLEAQLGGGYRVMTFDDLNQNTVAPLQGRRDIARAVQLVVVAFVVLMCGVGLAGPTAVAGRKALGAWAAISALAAVAGVVISSERSLVVSLWLLQAIATGWILLLGILFVRSKLLASARLRGPTLMVGQFFEYIMLGVMTAIVLVGATAFTGFQDGQLEGLRRQNCDLVVSKVSDLSTNDIEPRLSAIKGVRATCRRLVGPAWIRDAGADVKVEGLDPRCAHEVKPFLPDGFRLDKGQAWVGNETKLARDPKQIVLSVTASDLPERVQRFDVAGVYRSDYYDYDSAWVMLSYEDARTLLGALGHDELLVRTDGDERTADAVQSSAGGRYRVDRMTDLLSKHVEPETKEGLLLAWTCALALWCSVTVKTYTYAGELRSLSERLRFVLLRIGKRVVAALATALPLAAFVLQYLNASFQDTTVYYLRKGFALSLTPLNVAWIAAATLFMALAVNLPAALLPTRRSLDSIGRTLP